MALSNDQVVTIRLCDEVDVVRARQAAVRLARAAGLGNRAQARLDLVVAELSSNVVHHAGRGRIVLCATQGGDGRPEVTIDCTDSGPGMPAAETPARRGGLGLGLAAARELADLLVVGPGDRSGVRVEARVSG